MIRIMNAPIEETPPMNPIKLWQKERFGMFVNWGIYSMVGINEWCRRSERITEQRCH